MKYLILLMILSFVLEPGIVFAQDNEKAPGLLYGYVFNASRNHVAPDAKKWPDKNAAIAGQEVVLYKYVDGKTDEGERLHTITNAKGRFEFNILDVGKRFGYYPAAVVKGIEYLGGIVTITTDSLKKRSDILAFEPTQSDSSISVVMQHIIINPGAGALQVKEVVVFRNRGRYTYVGNTPTGQSGKNIVLSLEVPDKVTEVQFGGDLMSCCAIVNDNLIYDTMAFKPGVRQEVVSYVLPYKGQETSLIKKILHPTAAVDVFLPENSAVLNASGFASQGAFPIREENYQRFSAANFDKGSVMALGFTNLPASPRDWRWLPPVVFAALILVSFGIYYLHRKSKAALMENTSEQSFSTDPDTERQRLLDEILQLDEVYEAGNLDETTYFTAREKLKELVLAIDEQTAKRSSEILNTDLEDVSHEK